VAGWLLALAGLLVLVGDSNPALAQRVRVEADQHALTALLRKQMGTRWVLMRWRGADRLVFDKPRLSITPLGIYVSGRLASPSPAVDARIEVRIQPRIQGAVLTVDPDSVVVTRPTGVLGYVPRALLTRWLRSAAGRKQLQQFQIDLRQVLKAIGDVGKLKISLRLGFGRVALIVSLK